MSTLAVGASLLSTAWGIGSSIHNKNRMNRARDQRREYFGHHIAPLLAEATQQPDVDFDSIRDAEMRMPTLQFQNQMTGLTRRRDASIGQSGFADSGFINQDFDRDANMATEGLANQRFNVDRSIIDMQSQLESMINENKIRARELQFSYKYG